MLLVAAAAVAAAAAAAAAADDDDDDNDDEISADNHLILQRRQPTWFVDCVTIDEVAQSNPEITFFAMRGKKIIRHRIRIRTAWNQSTAFSESFTSALVSIDLVSFLAY